MTVKSGQAWYGLFVCKDATGALSTPSVGPAGALYVDGTVNAASVTISGSNPYKFAVTLPALTAGQCVSMYITATIATIATASVVAEDVADTVRLSDVPAVNVTMQAGVAVAAADANGNVPVVLYPTQGAVTFNGQVKILANVANQGALHVINSNAYGHGQYIEGGSTGQYNNGGNRGQWNQGSNYGQYNGGPTPVVGAAQQEIADALKRAPAAGTPAVGSVYGLLGDAALEATAQAILEDTGTAGALLSGIDSNVDMLLAVDTSTSDATTAGSISRRRGNSWAIPLTIGAITGYTSLWFTIKSSYDDADTSALVQVKLNSPSALDGLLYVNGTTASSAALGSITVSDATTGAIVVAVDETITDDLAPGTYYYDVQTLIAGNVATPDSGAFTVTADVTRSVA